MSYENDKRAFERTAQRIQHASRKSGKEISFDEAKRQLHKHIKKSKQ
tara:strand:+ start:312 stop:452 length:141 start_codon:yes stop_codon:yes gene_type:complete